jgi:hypothetical protein
MGTQRHNENSHERITVRPKLRLAGHLDATFDGRPLKISAHETEISVRVGIRAAAHLYRSRRNLKPVQLALAQSGIHILLNLGWLGSWRLA